MASDATTPMGPEGRQFSKEHEWALTVGEQQGYARVGISEYAAGELGEVVYVALPSVGTRVTQFEKFGEIESVKAVSDLFSPVSGEVVEVNVELVAHPEFCSPPPWGSPFDKGWMLLIRMNDSSELDRLMDSEQYQSYLRDLEHQATEGM